MQIINLGMCEVSHKEKHFPEVFSHKIEIFPVKFGPSLESVATIIRETMLKFCLHIPVK